MTDHGAQREIDPRFDPIFQRGYVPDAAAPAPDPTSRDSPPGRDPSVTGFGDSADTPQAPVAKRGEARESPNPATAGAAMAEAGMAEDGMAEAGMVEDGVAAGQAAAGQVTRAGLGHHAVPDRAVSDVAAPGRAVPGGAVPDVAAPDLPAASPAGPPDGGLEYAGADAEAAGAGGRFAPTAVFWIALGACVAFIVLGATLFWSQASDPSYFMGGRPGFTQTFQQFVMILSPSLVQAGVIGIVAVLVAWALRARHDHRGHEGRGRQ